MTGIFATKTVNAAGADGWFYGNPAFFWTQVKALLIVVPFSFCVSFLIFKFINLILPIRVSKTEEEEGLGAPFGRACSLLAIYFLSTKMNARFAFGITILNLHRINIGAFEIFKGCQ